LRIGIFGGDAGASGDFIETNGSGLTEVHGGLAGGGGEFDEVMAEGEVFAGEAVLFRAEDEGDVVCRVIEFAGDDGGELIEADDGLLGFAVGEGGGAEDEGAVANGSGESRGFAGVGEEFRSADGGAGFAPVGLIGCDDSEVGETEVGHGARDCADVEGIARRHEDDGNAIALLRSEQGMIVEPGV